MHNIDMPSQTFADVYTLCTHRTQGARQQAFNDKMGHLSTLCQLYDRKMGEHAAHEIVPMIAADVIPLTLDDYKNLYEDKLVAIDGGARSVYDNLLSRGKLGGCCYCTYGEATELDHLLPHSLYAEYVIYPKNLVPACHRCNTIKDSFWPRTQPDNFIHPYYENYGDRQWLSAKVVFLSGQPAVVYSVLHNDFDDPSIPVRIENQFKRLDLPVRFASQAAREIDTRKQGTWKFAFRAGGRADLVRILAEEFQGQAAADRNSWITVAYAAFLENAQFCDFQWV